MSERYMMRLTLKNTVTAGDLLKFGFDIGDQPKDRVSNLHGVKLFWADGYEDECFLSIEHSELWMIQSNACDSNERYFGNPQLFTILEMDRAGMFEDFPKE